MNARSKRRIFTLAVPALVAGIFSTAVQAADCQFTENRVGLCGYYDSEISAARAFVDTVVTRGNWGRPSQKPVIIDVRSTPEYRAGHPEHAVNVPYPYIYQQCNSAGRTPDGACATGKVLEIAHDPVAFADYVEAHFPDKDTPIYTLCRTGHRSVLAANVLTDRGYTNVRNIWEGFVGVNLTAPKVQPDGTTKLMSVDLNHDGLLTDEDKNGWRNHLALPYDTRLLPPLLFSPYSYTYYWD